MKTKIISAIIAIAFALSGCSANKIVYVPTPIQRAQIHLVKEPYYPIDDLTEADKHNYAKIVKAYADSLKMCRATVKADRMQIRKTNNAN